MLRQTIHELAFESALGALGAPASKVIEQSLERLQRLLGACGAVLFEVGLDGVVPVVRCGESLLEPSASLQVQLLSVRQVVRLHRTYYLPVGTDAAPGILAIRFSGSSPHTDPYTDDDLGTVLEPYTQFLGRLLERERRLPQQVRPAPDPGTTRQPGQLARLARFRQTMIEVVEEALRRGLDEGFYQWLLERAVTTVPGAQKGSIFLRLPSGDYRIGAAVGYDLIKLAGVRFSRADIALSADTVSFEPRLTRHYHEINKQLSDEVGRVLRDSGEAHNIRVALSVPVAIGGQLPAVLYLDNVDDPDAFGDEATETARVFGAQVGAVLQRLELQQAAERRTAFLESLSTLVSDALVRGVDAAFYQRLLERTVAIVPGAEAGSVLVRADDARFYYQAAVGYDLGALRQISYNLTQIHVFTPGSSSQLIRYDSTQVGADEAPVVETAGRLRDNPLTLVIPVTVRGELVALINLDAFSDAAPEQVFSPEAMRLAETFAQQLELVLQRLALQREAETRARFQSAVSGVLVKTLEQGLSQDVYSDILAQAVAAVPGAQVGSVLLCDNETICRHVAAFGYPLERLQRVHFSVAAALAVLGYDSWGDERSLLVSNPRPFFEHFYGGGVLGRRHLQPAVLLAVPVYVGERLLAVLNLGNHDHTAAFGPEAQQMAETFADQIGVVLQRLELEAESKRRAVAQRLLAQLEGLLLRFDDIADFFPQLADLLLGEPELGTRRIGIYRLNREGGLEPHLYSDNKAQDDAIIAELTKRELLQLDPLSNVMARVIASGEQLYLPDVRQHPEWIVLDANGADVGSVLRQPIRYRDAIWGVLDLEAPAKSAYDRPTRDLVRQIASSIELALVKQADREQLRRELRRMQALDHANTTLRGAATREAVYEATVDALFGNTVSKSCRLLRYDAEQDALVVVAVRGPGDDDVVGQRLSRNQGASWHVFSQNELLHLRPSQDSQTAQGYLGIPLIGAQHDVIGVLSVRGKEGRGFGDSDEAFLKALAQACSSAVVRLELLERSEREARAYRALANFGATIEEINDVGELMALGLEQLRDQLGLDVATYYDLYGDTLYPAPLRGDYPDNFARHRNASVTPVGINFPGYVAARGDLVYLPDTVPDLYPHTGLMQMGVRTRVGLPVRKQGAIVRVIVLASFGRTVSVSDEQLVVVRNFVRRLEHALERADTVREVAEARDAYQQLAEFGGLIEAINDVHELMQLGLVRLYEQFGLDAGGYYDVRDGVSYLIDVWGDYPDAVERLKGRAVGTLTKGSLGQVMTQGDVVYTEDYQNSPDAIARYQRLGLRTRLLLPVRQRGEIVKIVDISSFSAVVPLSPEQITIAKSFVRRLEHALERADNLQEVKTTREATLRALGTVLEHRDIETKGHTDRVVALSLRLGRALGLNARQLRDLRWGAYLHDLGKLAIPDRLLLKAGRFDADEYKQMKRHAELGYAMTADIPFLPHETRAVVRHHHERYDGSGYPDGLAGEQIPFLARIFSLADVYDALTNSRPYKPAWSVDDTLAELRRGSSTQFDPALVPLFIAVVQEPDTVF
ncbi:MAG: GAF domain-containing protein [Trueperaceae bacterium]|nr:GAF domain-containing protein [Trueperaceae bacterium]